MKRSYKKPIAAGAVLLFMVGSGVAYWLNSRSERDDRYPSEADFRNTIKAYNIEYSIPEMEELDPEILSVTEAKGVYNVETIAKAKYRGKTVTSHRNVEITINDKQELVVVGIILD